MTTVRPDLVNLPSLEIPTEGTTLFVVQDSAVNQTLTVQKARYLLNTQGPTGATGPTGWTGPQGISGYSGYSGISGYSGYSGISGYSGYSGYSGISGYSGYSGISGYSGYSGTSGYSGISGYSGYSGISGYSGLTGPTGPTGPTDAVNILGGKTGDIPIQVATSVTSFINLGNTGTLLQSNGITTATWVSTSSLRIGYSVNSDKLYSNQYTELELSPTKYIALTNGAGNYFDFGITNSLSYHTNNKKLSVPLLEVTSSTNSFSSTTGALVVLGGLGVNKDLYVGGEIIANKLTIEFTTVTMVSVTTDDVVEIKNNTSSTSTQTGALVVKGGVGIGENLRVGGIIYGIVDGIITTASNLANGTPGQIPYQISTGSTGFFGPGNIHDIVVSRGTAGPVFQNTLTLTSTLASSSSDTGALVVSGGTGIGGSLNVGQTSRFNQNLLVDGDVTINGGNLTSTATTFNLLNGIGYSGFTIPNRINIGTNVFQIDLGYSTGYTSIRSKLTVTNTAISTSVDTGALVVKGGVGIYGDVWVGGTINATVNGSINTASNIANGATGSIPIQESPGKTSFIPIGPSKSLLESNGSTGSWVSTNTIHVAVSSFSSDLLGGSVGSIPYQETANNTTFLAISTSGYILTSNGSAPIWTPPFGIVSNTATNLAGGTAGQTPYQISPGITSFYGPGTAGDIVVSRGTSGPTYQNTLTLAGVVSATNTVSGTLQVRGGVGIGGDLWVGGDVYVLGQANYIVNQAAVATTATNLAGGTAGQTPYQVSPGITSFYGPGTAGDIVVSRGTSGPIYQNTLTLSGTTQAVNTTTGALQVRGGVGIGGDLYVGGTINGNIVASGSITTATNLAGGAAGSIPYQSAPGLTTFVGIGTAGFILRSTGSAPEWISTSTLVAANSNLTNDLLGGTAGQIVYQRAPNDTDFAGPGSAGQLLISRGSSSNGPVFQSTVTIQTLSVGTAWYGGADGEIRAAGEITAYWGSDIRLKENIRPINSALDVVNQIRGVRFDWNEEYMQKRGGEDGYFVRKNDIGVIAQEIELVLPEIVGTRDDGMKVVKYERLTALLIEAIKELSNEIKNLKK